MTMIVRLGVIALLIALVLGNLAGIGQPPPPPSAPVAPNASLITAKVLKYSIWNGQLLGRPADETFYSLVLKVHTSQPVAPDLLNLVQPDETLEAFSKTPLSPDLFGERIEATVRLAGDERGQRFWIHDVRIVQDKD